MGPCSAMYRAEVRSAPTPSSGPQIPSAPTRVHRTSAELRPRSGSWATNMAPAWAPAPPGPAPLLVLLEVEAMDEAVHHRGEEHRHRGEKDDPAEERVAHREELPGIGPHRIDRAHAREDHRRVQPGVDAGEPTPAVVADGAEGERAEDDDREHGPMASEPDEERPDRQQRPSPVLEHRAPSNAPAETHRGRA